MTTRRPSRPGYTLLEMLFYVALIGVALVFSAGLLQRMMRVHHNAHDAQTSLLRHDRILDRMRDDMWNTISARALGERTLELKMRTTQRVVWVIDQAGEHVLRRSLDGDAIVATQRYDAPPGLAFEQVGEAVSVRLKPDDPLVQRRSRVTIYPQRALLEPTP